MQHSEYSNVKPSILVKACFRIIKRLDIYPSKYQVIIFNLPPFHQTKVGQIYQQIKVLARFYEKNGENKDLETEFYRLMDSLVTNIAKKKNINMLAISEMIKVESLNLSDNMMKPWLSAYCSLYIMMIIGSLLFGAHVILSLNDNTKETQQVIIK